MVKATYLTHESVVPVQPGQTVMLLARPQSGIVRPHRLRIDPTMAPFFQIEDVRVGVRSQFPAAQRVPASQFMIGNGADFDVEEIMPCQDFLMVVMNIADRVPHGVQSPIPFTATWACLERPVSVATLSERARADVSPRIVRDHAPMFSLRGIGTPPDIHLITGCSCGWRTPRDVDDSEEAYIQHAAANPPSIRRVPSATPLPTRKPDHPGFGWDPGYGDD